MYIQNNSSYLYSVQDEKPLSSLKKENDEKVSADPSLKNFSEKATLAFEDLAMGLDKEEKNDLVENLNSISKTAAFFSMNGFESQSERILISQYFENFGGVLSEDAIKKMIYSKLNNPSCKNRDFLERFAKALGEPLQSINIRV